MKYHWCLVIINLFVATNGIEIFSTAFFSQTLKTLQCSYWQCCIGHNVENFEHLFDQNVFGQHLARDIVSKALKSHLRKIKMSSENKYSGTKQNA